MNKNLIFIIDNGHGGIINGEPQTAGKRSPDFGDGILYEGVSNRSISDIVFKKLYSLGIPAVLLVPESEDVSLAERVRRANKIARDKKDAILISIHSDAYTSEQANGWSAFTTRGETRSDRVATILYKHAKKACLKLRTDHSDKDPDKESDFYILRKTICRAVLVENLFMTNKQDYKFLKSCIGKKILANIIINAAKEIYENEKYNNTQDK